MAAAEHVLDYFESALLQLKHFPQVWPRHIWETYITDSFANSPVLCEYLRSAEGWYAQDLVTLMETGEAKRRSHAEAVVKV